ncbi:MAG: BrnT family toxin, partial [Deltaproteobacteria bacterium]|nr:BrnT family toxin [Deltaproteobacteria bacterium]
MRNPFNLEHVPVSFPDCRAAARFGLRSAYMTCRSAIKGIAFPLQRKYKYIDVMELRFQWDEQKHTENKRKHGVGFDEAQTVFHDHRALLIDDPDHSAQEDRFVLLG